MGWSKAVKDAYMRKTYVERKQGAIDLLGGCCAKCGSTEDLQFDHIDPKTKVATITVLLCKRSSRLAAEISKCQLLCAQCHKEKTVQERGQVLARGTHGTLSAYRYCRCDACRQAKTKYERERRGGEARSKPACGTYRRYRSGCRCEACRAANALRMKQYKAEVRSRS